MPNRQLTSDELENIFSPLIEEVRNRLQNLSGDDTELLWALRRKLYKELTYDERGKPSQRKKLKEIKRSEQDNKCAICLQVLPDKYVILDRYEAMDGYTKGNTRLLCQDCDTKVQQDRGYK